MSWNYRVIKHVVDADVFYAIHEVYYTPDGDIEAWSEQPIHPQGDTLGELQYDVDLQNKAFSKAVLIEDADTGRLVETE